jgi:putative transposase
MARQLTDGFNGFACGKTHLIIDRNTKYCSGFREILGRAGVKIVLCPPRVPQCNAYAEQFVRSVKHECLDRLILLGKGHLRSAASDYVEHYNGCRNHQGMDTQLAHPAGAPQRRKDSL